MQLLLAQPAAAQEERRSTGFSYRLEALRGLAALMVVGHHIFPLNVYSWPHVLFNGEAAVSLFFVLSGYVLGLSLRRSTGSLPLQYWVFLVRRILRIYPAYFFTSALFLLYLYLRPKGLGLGPLSHYANLHLNFSHVLGNFSFLDQSLNGVTWSLKVEMVGSVLLPFFYFASRGRPWSLRIAFLAVLIGLSFTAGDANSRRSLYMFYLGYLVFDLEETLPPLGGRAYAAVTFFSVACFLSAFFIRDVSMAHPLRLLIQAASTAGMILGLQVGGGSMGGILDRPWARFAGRVSYSLFLVHTLIEDIVMNLVDHHVWPASADRGFLFCCCGFALSVAVTMPAAWLLFRWVELPFINLGKGLCPIKRARGAVKTPVVSADAQH